MEAELAPDHPRDSHASAQGVLATWANSGLSLLGPLLLVPIFLHFLGIRRYGLWLVITSITPVLGLANLGLTWTVGNALAEDFAAPRRRDTNVLISSAFVCYATLAAAGAAIVLPLVWVWAKRSGSDLGSIGGQAAEIFCILCLAALPFKTFQVALRAARRVFVEQWSAAAAYLMKITLAVALLALGFRLRALAAVQGAAILAPGLFSYFFCRRYLRISKPQVRLASWATTRRMLKPSAYFLVLQLSGTISFGVDTWVIGQHLGLAAVTSYGVAYQAVNAGIALWAATIGALAPFVTARYSLGGLRDLASWYATSLKLGVLYCGAALVFLSSSGAPLLRLWTRTSVFPGGRTWGLLLAFLAVQVLLIPADMLLMATSTHINYAKLALVEAVLNLGLSLWWVRIGGTSGVIGATLAARAFTILWFLPTAAAHVLQTCGDLWAALRRPLVVGLSLASTATLLAAAIGLRATPGDRASIASGIALTAVFVVLYILLGLTAADRRAGLAAISALCRRGSIA